MQLLKQAQVFCPSIVPDLQAGSGYIIFSAMRILGRGPTFEAALDDARDHDNLPDLPPFPAFRGNGLEVQRRGDVVATAVSRTYADRIANALNEYFPNERGI
jgi:hypothetical protein